MDFQGKPSIRKINKGMAFHGMVIQIRLKRRLSLVPKESFGAPSHEIVTKRNPQKARHHGKAYFVTKMHNSNIYHLANTMNTMNST